MKKTPLPTTQLPPIQRRCENIALIGMLIIAATLIVPLFNLTAISWLSWLKYLYALGALTYLGARVVAAIKTGKNESARLRRLRRMPAWAGVAFCIAAAFWFYSQYHLGPYAGPLALLRQTILFSLVGAVLQIVSSWMIYAQIKKEQQK